MWRTPKHSLHHDCRGGAGKIRRDGDAETIYALPVLDDERHLIGVTGLRALVVADTDALVGEVMRADVHRVDTHADGEPATRLVRNEGLIALPVVDAEDCLVGVIIVHDAMAVLDAEASEDALVQVGALLDLVLGAAVHLPVALIWERDLGVVVSMTLVGICLWALVVGAAAGYGGSHAGIRTS